MEANNSQETLNRQMTNLSKMYDRDSRFDLRELPFMNDAPGRKS
jgi:hypothetical protein